MSKKLTEEIKSTPSFLFAKVKGLNNRESARFSALFENNEDFTNASNNRSAIYAYVCLSREPALDATLINYDPMNPNPGTIIEKPSRSKIVMAYEKQRKAYMKVKELRSIKRDEVDNLMSQVTPSSVNVPPSTTYRLYVLQHILRYISTTK
jgi:hypothetical protein